MNHEILWAAVQEIWREQKPIRRPGRQPSTAMRIAELISPDRKHAARMVKFAGLDRPMMEEAWFASLSHAQRACAKRRPARRMREKVRAPMVSDFMVDRLMALSEQADRLRRAG